jgi:hypothetical protein
MKQIKDYSDDRYKGACLHCGSVLGLDSTSDHVPTKALLDRPLPENVHVVDTCRQCNNGFSSDEEYFAAFLSAAMSGSTEPNEQPFDTARSVLAGNAKLRREIEASKTAIPGTDGPPRTAWIPEIERIHRVVVKNARGHAFHELGRPLFHEPDQISIAPIETIDEERLADFLTIDMGHAWPEVGSRLLQRVAAGIDMAHGWIIVQPEIYVFAVIETNGVTVRSIIREYLLTEVTWLE